MLYIIIIVICIVIINNKNAEIEELERQLRIAKKKIAMLEENKPRIEQEHSEEMKLPQKTQDFIVRFEEKIESTNTPIDEHTIPKKISEEEQLRETEKNESKNRNNTILTVGAFFIVIAAISFLYSTWEILPDIIKSGVILILAGVFLGISKLAEKVFKLTKTSNTFFYISMAYIPICLFSISLFGLAGEYLSFAGEGKYIYLSICSFLIMQIYSYFGKTKKDSKLYISSLAMQLVLVMCVAAIMFEKFAEILCVVLLYTTILNLLNDKFIKTFVEETKKYRSILISIILTFSTLTAVFSSIYGMLEIIISIGTIVNLFILYIQKSKNIYYKLAYVLIFITLGRFLYIDSLNISFMVKQVVIFIAIALSAFYYNWLAKDDEIIKFANGANICLMLITYMFTIFQGEEAIDLFVLGCFGNLIAVVTYFKNKQNGLFATSMIINNIAILLPTNYGLETSFMSYLLCAISSVILLVITHRNEESDLKIIPIITLFVNLYRYKFIIGDALDVTLIINIALILIFGFISIKDKKDMVYRLSSFVYLIGLCVNESIDIYFSTTLFIIWGLIQTKFTEGDKKKFIQILIVGSLIIMNLVMISQGFYDEITLKSYILGIMNALICLIAFRKEDNLKFIPLYCFIVPLYSYKLILFRAFDVTFLLNLLLIGIFTILSFKKEKNYILISFIYLLGLLIKFDINNYIQNILVIIWGTIQLLNSEGGLKQLIKVLIATSSLCIYRDAITDLEMVEITALNLLGFIIYSHVITRKVLKEYIEDYKIIEYIAIIIIYICSFSMFKDSTDLMVFIVMQAVMLIVAYMNKLGPLFAVTVPTMIMNTIFITRAFWFGISWWIYLVAIGGILIIFAARNELVEKKDVQTMKEKLNKVKDFLDM